MKNYVQNIRCIVALIRELAPPGNSAIYPNIQIFNDDTLGTSYKAFSIHLKSQFIHIVLRALLLTILLVRIFNWRTLTAVKL